MCAAQPLSEMSLSKLNSPPSQGCFEIRGFLPGRMKTFSTDNMAAMGSSISSQSREAAFMTAQVRLGGRGNCTRNSPSLVTWPLLIAGKKQKKPTDSTTLCLNVNGNKHTQCYPPYMDKEQEINASSDCSNTAVCVRPDRCWRHKASVTSRRAFHLSPVCLCLLHGRQGYLSVSHA